MSEEEEALSDIDRLHILQRVPVTEESQVRKLWAQEILNLARALNRMPEEPGLNKAAMGGIYYCLNRLQESFEGKELAELEELYVQVELQSYPLTEAAMQQTCRECDRRGIKWQVVCCPFPDGDTRYRVSSAIDQISNDRVAFTKGELIHSCDRFPPPLYTLI